MSGSIAIVDDDRDVGEIIYRRLKRTGYQCIFIPDSEKAFLVLKSRKPDLAILDVMMPKVSGYDLCRQIRRDPLIFNTPILMLSALGGEPEVDSIWINILESGGAHTGHIHANSVISGTIYLEVPSGASPIRFEDPRLPMMIAAPPRKADASLSNGHFYSVQPEAGDVLLWESWHRQLYTGQK